MSDNNSSKTRQQQLDSNGPIVCWWAILTILEAELGSPSIIELVASCLSFPTTLILLESEFYNFRYG